MTKKLLALYGLKWNPFAPDVPADALRASPAIDTFCRRVDSLAREGGFALVSGDPGTGKSVALRILVDRLGTARDLKVGLLSRPQARLADFYRELGDLFGVPLVPHNRWAGARALRETWQTHIDAALVRPVLVVDEAQEMRRDILNELRLLASSRLDSHLLLTIVLAGDRRLLEALQSDDLAPVRSRLRVRLALDRASSADLEACLRHAIQAAGAPHLMTPELIATLCEHAAGNCRTLMNLAAELLVDAEGRDLPRLDEKLFLETFAPAPRAPLPGPVLTAAPRR